MISDDLVINPGVENRLKEFIDEPTHALGIVAPTGSGKNSVGLYVAASLLSVNSDRLSNYPYFKEIMADSNSISIEKIREIQHFLKLRVPSANDKTTDRVLLINNAELITPEAQNALLKQLEEPPASTVIILTLDNIKSVLPTIISRIQAIYLYRPTDVQLEAFFSKKGFSGAEVKRAVLICNGLPGMINSVLSDENSLILDKIEEAKEVLRLDNFERLKLVDNLGKDKASALLLIQMIGNIARSTIYRHAEKEDSKGIIRWAKILTATDTAEKALRLNSQPKLTLTNLMLEL